MAHFYRLKFTPPSLIWWPGSSPPNFRKLSPPPLLLYLSLYCKYCSLSPPPASTYAADGLSYRNRVKNTKKHTVNLFCCFLDPFDPAKQWLISLKVSM